MKKWIEINLDPPGMERKNWHSVFSFIGRVFGIVKEDAIKAHNAFFPYLCDEDKLRQHGDSLMIPELPFDTEKIYRDRVSTASFYLMRAGERAYIHEQLQARLGDRYIINEEFLQIYLKVSELSKEERIWAYSFLDGILDPNISFSIAELFNFIDLFNVSDYLLLKIKKIDTDIFGNRLKFNGAIKFDGKTINKKIAVKGKFNGIHKFNGDLSFNGSGKTIPSYQPKPPFKFSSGIIDKLIMDVRGNTVSDQIETSETVFVGMRKHHHFNGRYKFDGLIKFNSTVLNPIG